MDKLDRDQDAMRKRDSRLVDRLVCVRPLVINGGDRIGFALEDSSPIPNHPEGLHIVKVMLDPGESLSMRDVIGRA